MTKGRNIRVEVCSRARAGAQYRPLDASEPYKTRIDSVAAGKKIKLVKIQSDILVMVQQELRFQTDVAANLGNISRLSDQDKQRKGPGLHTRIKAKVSPTEATYAHTMYASMCSWSGLTNGARAVGSQALNEVLRPGVECSGKG
ncbi:hypothetical protein PoB_005712600 [Plakobranchus ocellatus]|uniref:Uncharacterized protein n=1 Tax=Plakobranchus ocellatus TaxID=259542 RepID=A0AAV4CCZ8_9GAST|nr:hypothetical protein PoB_005712600 [Plakobranchus ocellatus]